MAERITDDIVRRARTVFGNVLRGTGSEHNAWRAALADYAEGAAKREAVVPVEALRLVVEMAALTEDRAPEEHEALGRCLLILDAVQADGR